MQLSISTTYKPATDLGYLLHKNPEKIQEFEITGGKAYVFYPEASENRCTATMLLNIDNMNLARVKKLTGSEFMQQNYVNDRPFTASSFILGLEALSRFVKKKPLRKIHECIFGVLAMESEEVDPRL